MAAAPWAEVGRVVGERHGPAGAHELRLGAREPRALLRRREERRLGAPAELAEAAAHEERRPAAEEGAGAALPGAALGGRAAGLAPGLAPGWRPCGKNVYVKPTRGLRRVSPGKRPVVEPEALLHRAIERRRARVARPLGAHAVGELEAAVPAPGVAQVRGEVEGAALAGAIDERARVERGASAEEVLQRVERVRAVAVERRPLVVAAGVGEPAQLHAVPAARRLPRQLLAGLEVVGLRLVEERWVAAEAERAHARGAVAQVARHAHAAGGELEIRAPAVALPGGIDLGLVEQRAAEHRILEHGAERGEHAAAALRVSPPKVGTAKAPMRVASWSARRASPRTVTVCASVIFRRGARGRTGCR
jgi:hypothetical protein